MRFLFNDFYSFFILNLRMDKCIKYIHPNTKSNNDFHQVSIYS